MVKLDDGQIFMMVKFHDDQISTRGTLQVVRGQLKKDRIVFELATSDRKLEASREGST
jgi:hypothetical protein